MYKSIYVPVDNSDHSNRAVACALGLGKAYSAKLVGCHVYAAKLHDYRFRQMEYTLPEEYIDEVELERQRKIHDSLITMGLKLISDSYLDGMSRLCGESGIAFEPRMMDGKHHSEILKDLDGSQHDLVVIGALGIGRARDSVIGSVCERVARQADRDVWVVKHVPEPGEAERDTILVGMDGSPQSFGALTTAIDLARTFGKKVEAIAAPRGRIVLAAGSKAPLPLLAQFLGGGNAFGEQAHGGGIAVAGFVVRIADDVIGDHRLDVGAPRAGALRPVCRAEQSLFLAGHREEGERGRKAPLRHRAGQLDHGRPTFGITPGGARVQPRAPRPPALLSLGAAVSAAHRRQRDADGYRGYMPPSSATTWLVM